MHSGFICANRFSSSFGFHLWFVEKQKHHHRRLSSLWFREKTPGTLLSGLDIDELSTPMEETLLFLLLFLTLEQPGFLSEEGSKV